MRKKAKIDTPVLIPSVKPVALEPKKPKEVTPKPRPKASKETALQKMLSQGKSSMPKTRKDNEEDNYIAYLESKLGYGRGKGKSKPVGDGLDGA